MTRLVFGPLALALALALAGACGPGSKGGPTLTSKVGGGDDLPPPMSPVVSRDILEREPLANTAQAKHILIGWRDLDETTYQGRIDPRAAKRDKAAAEAEVKSLVEQLQGGADFDALMKAHSEDPGSASTGRAYEVRPDSQLVIEFRQLSLRLKVGEIGVVESDFGFHIIKRLE